MKVCYKTKSLRTALLFSLFYAVYILAAVTVHVKNPWASEANYNDELRIVGDLPELGTTQWEGGAILMTDEGNDWHSYTFSAAKTSTANIKVVRWKGNSWTTESIPLTSLQALFSGSSDEESHVWVTLNPLTTTFDPLDVGATVINLLNPFPESSPSIVIGADTIQMDRNPQYTGWYMTFYMGSRAPLDVSFVDYFRSEEFGKNGKTGNFETIDLAPVKDSGNALFIWPEPKYSGPARVSGQFPGVFGEPDTMVITALVHDMPQSDTAFEEGFRNSTVALNIAGEYLDSNGKIQKGSSDAFKSGDMPSWFETRILGPDQTNDTCIDIVLTKTNSGGWEFNSDNTGGFFPIDGFDPYGEGLYYGHNFSFVMELRTQFEYHEGTDQIFTFDGDDDVWVYINGRLAIDLGGPHPSLTESVNLDDIRNDFGLEDGKKYNLDMFYCERECSEEAPDKSANFRMNTTLTLENISSLILNESTSGDTTTITIDKLTTGEYGKECGINVSDVEDIDTNDAVITTYILYGPQFGNNPDTLGDGTNYGGIYIDPNRDNLFSLTPTKMSGLIGGEYTLLFIDEAYFSSTYQFTVYGEAPLKVDTSGTEVDPNPNIVQYETLSLDVKFTTDSDCIIEYEVLSGVASVSGSGTFNGSGAITMSDDTVVVRVNAVGNNDTPHKLSSSEEIYTFVRILPPAQIVADSSVAVPDSVVFSTARFPVTLKIINALGDEIPLSDDAKLWYSFGTDDPKSGTRYSAGDTIWLTKSDTINAAAELTEYTNPENEQWYYYHDRSGASLTANPSRNPVYYFGRELKVTLSSEADTIRFTDNGDDVTRTSTLFDQDSDTIIIRNSDPDTTIIKGLAYDDNFTETTAEWTYVRDTLPPVTISAVDSKFSSTMSLTLSLDANLDNGWNYIDIFYTTDGSKPDSTSNKYSGRFTIDTTLTVQAIAYTNNRIESPVAERDFIQIADIVSAWYLDKSGDGAIDNAVIELSKKVTEVPARVVLISPFDSTEQKELYADDIELVGGDRLEIEFNNPFTFYDNTAFKRGIYGTLNGTEYETDDSIYLSDSIAPVLITADYYSGEIVKTEPEIVRAPDTVKVRFSEPLYIENMEHPFDLERNGIPYTLIMKETSSEIESDSGIFVVDYVNGTENPVPGDIIHINSSAGAKANGAEQTNEDNLWVLMTVHEPPYYLEFTAISPENPDEFKIPEELAPEHYLDDHGIVIIVDFMSKLWNSESVSAKVTIFDALGNEVSSTSQMNEGTHLVAELKQDPRTRVVIYWDGRNEKSRRVGTGAYLAVISIVDPNGKEVVERIPIGIKK